MTPSFGPELTTDVGPPKCLPTWEVPELRQPSIVSFDREFVCFALRDRARARSQGGPERLSLAICSRWRRFASSGSRV